MPKPTRTFTGQEGQRSTGTAGPEQIAYDLDQALKMFDPEATLPGGGQGGINEENMREGAVTDHIIGDRTVNQSLSPTGNTGKLTQFLSGFANRIRAITGKPNWYDAPATTLEAAKAHMEAPAPHPGHLRSIGSVPGDSSGNVELVAGPGITITSDEANRKITFSSEGAPGGFTRHYVLNLTARDIWHDKELPFDWTGPANISKPLILLPTGNNELYLRAIESYFRLPNPDQLAIAFRPMEPNGSLGPIIVSYHIDGWKDVNVQLSIRSDTRPIWVELIKLIQGNVTTTATDSLRFWIEIKP